MTEKILKDTVEPLLKFYQDSARDLPWRRTRDAYKIWVSEIMLQQTRVETVREYYERFVKELPSVFDLAECPEQKLLKLWEGLGYYSRARNMQKAAAVIVKDYHGELPREYEKLIKLAGIGEYTAGAICSIAFNEPVPAVDGNVVRVISRLTAQENLEKSEIFDLLKPLYQGIDCGAFTQSLMELGACVCTPNTSFKCESCPLKHICRAYEKHCPERYPTKPLRKQRQKSQVTVLLLRCQNKTAIQKRAHGLLGGMWEFPSYAQSLTKEQAAQLITDAGGQILDTKKGVSHKHIFTHAEWEMCSYIIECAEPFAQYAWLDKDTLIQNYPLPTAFKPFLQALADDNKNEK